MLFDIAPILLHIPTVNLHYIKQIKITILAIRQQHDIMFYKCPIQL